MSTPQCLLLAVFFVALGSCDKGACDDQIQNGNETRIDCGGPDCSPCPILGLVSGGICNPTVYQDIALVNHEGTPLGEAELRLTTPIVMLNTEWAGFDPLSLLLSSEFCTPPLVDSIDCLDTTYTAVYTDNKSIDTSLISFELLSGRQIDSSVVVLPQIILESLLEGGGLMAPDSSFHYSILVEVERCHFNLAIRLGSTFVPTVELYAISPTLAAYIDSLGGVYVYWNDATASFVPTYTD